MANLTSLPQETISQIALCLDRHSGLSLALTCRAFAGPAEARLWQTLELSLSPYYGVSPPIQPHEGAFPLAERGGAFLLRHRPYTALEAWAWNQVETAEEAYRTALPGIIDRIIRMADGRRWALVREITAAPRVGAIAGIVRVLRNAAPRLAELHLDEPTSLDALAPIFPADIDTLDYALIRADLHFPFLTYLRLGHDSVRFSDLILLFLHAAPNLTDRDFDTWGLWDLPADAETQMPQLQGETKLRRLKMEFADRGRQEETDESSPVLEMLRRSPLVEQLSEGYMDQNVVVYDGLVKTAWTMRGLRDYHWRWEPSDFMDSVVYTMGELETPGFTGLKRLVYSHASFDYMQTRNMRTM
ncbi:uncharacterized protein MKK02DRAFT_39088 [Dioszegia hungarica]|uniref:F-box domain-containing protein n=1 Tax=Dioszegia hungarica TaxID=4972 RepID=A0AA38H377_9TREE|nr:uncharacterized protein MKK02DRAFT_39088 [Dioszegia hungarica]KAI9633393.1 hypothetical protein MKK02DRAFT_39088 [Dioszegia hungarica]